VQQLKGDYMVAKDPDDDSDTRRLFIPMKNKSWATPKRAGISGRAALAAKYDDPCVVDCLGK